MPGIARRQTRLQTTSPSISNSAFCQAEQRLELVPAKITDPLFARADCQVGQFPLGANHVIDTLFKRSASDESVDLNVALLANAIGSVLPALPPLDSTIDRSG